MPMGSIDEAVAFLMQLGPAAEAVKEADEKDRFAVAAAVKDVLVKYDGVEGLLTPAATWLVTAEK
jgi:hypothetical protein